MTGFVNDIIIRGYCITCSEGRITSILPKVRKEMTNMVSKFSHLYSRNAREMKASEIRELLKLTDDPQEAADHITTRYQQELEAWTHRNHGHWLE